MLKKLFGFAAFVLIARAQNPQSAAYPTNIATDNTLLVASNNGQSVLAAALNNSASTFTMTTSTNFIAPTALTIDSGAAQEIVMCSTLTGSVYSGCTRGFQGTSAVSHVLGAPVYENAVAWYPNQAAAEIKAIETALGTNFHGGGTTTKNTSYFIQAADNGTLLSFNGSSLTATLPTPPPTAQWTVRVVNLNSTNLTLSPNGLTINGSGSSITLAQYQSTTIWTDGSNYYQIALPPGAGTTAIGSTVSSATACSVLFINSGPVLAQDNANLCYYSATHDLIVGGNVDGNFRGDIQSSGSAGTFRVYDQTPSTGVTSIAWKTGAGQGAINLALFQDYSGVYQGGIDASMDFFSGTISSGRQAALSSLGFLGSSASAILWSSGTSLDTGSFDTSMGRVSAGVVEVNNTTVGHRYGTSIQAGSGLFYDNTPTTGVTEAVIRAGAGQSTNLIMQFLNNAGALIGGVGPTGDYANYSSGNGKTDLFPGAPRFSSDTVIQFSNNVNIGSGSIDTGFARNAAGVVEIDNGTAGVLRDLAVRNITCTGSGCGGSPVAPYTLCASGCSQTIPSLSFTITAATHGAGANALVECIDAFGNILDGPACGVTEPGITDGTFTFALSLMPSKIIIR